LESRDGNESESVADRMTRFERAARARGFSRVAGLDEAGRGPLAGPVVAAAVILPPGCRIPGLRDSKKLSAPRREALMEVIKSSAVAIGLGIIDETTIDRINIYRATQAAMIRAVRLLEPQPDFLLIDAVKLSDCPLPQHSIVGGDDLSLSIAAASVVAKVSRDRMMLEYDRMFPDYNFKSHKGYGTREHLQALKRLGPCEIHRRTFRGVV
jgi:ribonuclease HII